MNSGLYLSTFSRFSQLCTTTSLTPRYLRQRDGRNSLQTPVLTSSQNYAIEVIRHLPYFESTFIEYVHYKSKLLDLTAFTLEDFEKRKNYHQDWEFWSSEGELMDPSDVLCIAVGHESFSRELWLNVKECEIFEDFHTGDMLDAVPVEDFFDDLKDRYQSLEPIPGKRRIIIEAEKVPERHGRITEEEATGQTEEWGTDLDIQYARQIYRDHGWPGSFDLQMASEPIDKWLELLGGGSGGGPRGLVWQQSLSDWDETRWT